MGLDIARVLLSLATGVFSYVVWNVAQQLYFKNPKRPPVVFHWLPLIGSTVQYGMDPYQFFADCRKKYGDCFTFILLGKPTTVCLGSVGNEFILNGKTKDLNAEEIYGPLTQPIFGKGVVYDCPTSKFMDQKRLLGMGLNERALRGYVPMFRKEVEDYIATSPIFKPEGGICDISAVMAEITIYTAARSLQGKEIRDKLDAEVSLLYRQLDDGFIPINFVMPGLPLPVNKRRDNAQREMSKLYLSVIDQRRKSTERADTDAESDMLDLLMTSSYKDGTKIPDIEVANLMVALLMAGQHNTCSVGSWIVLHLAHLPHLQEELYQEQLSVLGSPLPPLTHEQMEKLPLHNFLIKETLRLHSPIHSVLRKVKSPMPFPGTEWVIPPTHTLLAAPGFLGRTEEFFPRPMEWDPHRWEDPIRVRGAAADESAQDDDPSSKVDYGFGLVSLKSIRSPYLPFGGGRHRCVAEKYAYAQLTAIIATMVRLLQWEQVDPKAPVPPTDYSSMFSRPMHPAEIRWRHRKT